MAEDEDEYPGGWFGESWNAPVNDPARRRQTPVGSPCLDCKRDIEPGDQGLLIPHCTREVVFLAAMHIECFLRDIRAGEESSDG